MTKEFRACVDRHKRSWSSRPTKSFDRNYMAMTASQRVSEGFCLRLVAKYLTFELEVVWARGLGQEQG